MPKRSNLLRLICIAAAGMLATGQAAMAEPQEIKVVEHADTDAVTDTGDKGDTAGDILTFANDVYDADDKAKVGSDQGICFRTLVGKAWECFWTLSLDKGQITVEGPFLDAGTWCWPSPAAPAILPAPRATWCSKRAVPTARPTISSTASNSARAQSASREDRPDPIRLLRIGYTPIRKDEGVGLSIGSRGNLMRHRAS